MLRYRAYIVKRGENATKNPFLGPQTNLPNHISSKNHKSIRIELDRPCMENNLKFLLPFPSDKSEGLL